MAITAKEKSYLSEMAYKIRVETLKMLNKAESGHPGGSLSMADILSSLYFKHMNIDPENGEDPDRDRLVLSKGHGVPGLYSVLALKGFFPLDELQTLRDINSRLQGHPDRKGTPGIEMTTGSLGQGLSAANGMALAAKMDGRDYNVYCILGDGEIQEGQIWEAAMTASHYKIDNLIGILDYNGLQIDGKVEDIMDPGPVSDKWRAFGWYVIETDGHDLEKFNAAIEEAKGVKDQPVMIVADTVKGKGVSYMENVVDWHGKAPGDEELEQALEELEQGLAGTRGEE
ncbi:transketolase [Natranaerobius thermophilus]|uniref:Transketolase subunit A n=1 Tax=Natranaerobius thermophilus (strain ATCC BAA-1301 / DSM 18059 / JW/NM-WN-LF) TaxID=457570 RepID=B2A808_NATTJ|nr:transketolase [Natranaerobius thermophilus]ACB85780.1 transketolase subunit A [Natranaerobius thermophilus JW/NM-WN-LF]